MIKVCEWCGDEYKTTYSKQKFCSQDCHGESRVLEYEKHTCDFCGDEFRRPAYKLTGKHKYCSLKCSNNWQVKKSSKKSVKQIVRHYKCEWCGKDCVQNNRHTITKKFCSISCSNRKRWDDARRSKQRKD